MTKPRIGITGPVTGDRCLKWWLRTAIKLAGGEPVNLRTNRDWENRTFDGLLIGGGTDINPERYGESAPAPDKQFDLPRDAMEDALIQRAVKERIPILGICRGMQMINVSLGGSLYQEAADVLEDFLPSRSLISKIIGRREVMFTKDSKLFPIMGSYPNYLVNSIHHQAVNKLGKGLRVVAREKNGLVQAFENDRSLDHPFLFGVQWHPELMLHANSARSLFKALVKASQSR